MLVDLTYFRISGKYYSAGSFTTEKENLWEIWHDVEEMLSTKRLPGLMTGHSPYHVLVDVPKHPFRHPHLILAV